MRYHSPRMNLCFTFMVIFLQISNNGEFIDNVYREQEPSKLVGRIIGRNQVQMHAKKVYTTADIVCETYLHKKGSWMQNWYVLWPINTHLQHRISLPSHNFCTYKYTYK